MGYEVMDAHGARDQPSGRGGDLADVVDLGPAAEPAPTDDRPVPRWSGAVQSLARLRAGGGAGLPLAVGAALVVGALLGGFVTGQRAAADERAQRRSQLQVVAQVESSTTSRRAGEVRAELTAVLTNAGPEPVELDVARPDAVASRLTPVVVTRERAEPRIAPGGSAAVRVQVLLDCSAPPSAVSVRVRTADDRSHDVALQSAPVVVTACAANADGGAQVGARLEGSTAAPVLVVANGGEDAVGVSFASIVSAGSPAVEGLVTVLTRPAMPLILGPGQERRTALTVRATRCQRDLGVLGQLDAFAHPSLVVTDPNGTVLQGGSPGTNVDLSLLVADAVVRACA